MSAKSGALPPHISDPGLVGSLQSEVAAEASPLMSFLVAHTRKIIFALLFCIAAIVGYSIYAWQAESRKAEEAKELGKLLIISDPALRLAKLEAFASEAPDSVRHSAWFAILDAAEYLQDKSKIIDAWNNIRKTHETMQVPAALGVVKTLAVQGNYAEALQSLEEVAKTKLAPLDLVNVSTRIVLLAEVVGDYAKAIAACDAVLGEPALNADVKSWIQKRANLEYLLKRGQAGEPVKAAGSEK